MKPHVSNILSLGYTTQHVTHTHWLGVVYCRWCCRHHYTDTQHTSTSAIVLDVMPYNFSLFLLFQFHLQPGCNRTYYGDLGMTNKIELMRPKDDRLPFTCELNFTAAGGIHGNIVQVSWLHCFHSPAGPVFLASQHGSSVWATNTGYLPKLLSRLFSQITIDGFLVGRFCSYVTDGCPDGYLQISETERTSVGGMWCGGLQDDGPVVFFSETRTLKLTLKLLR